MMARSTAPVINGFSFIEAIGEGGFADVFRYRQEMPEREVAVKVLLDSAMDGDGVELFKAEANVMAQLAGHPSIVPIHAAGIGSDGRPYLVMEYCPPPHLATRYRAERISVHEALDISIKIASAVETAHRAGILHRDIKPHNILTSVRGVPMLTDFGIAGTMGEGSTWSGGLSVPWSPPEAFGDDPPADVRSDVFSLAATTYTLLAGRSPFEISGAANDNATLMSRIERQPLAPLTRADVPEALNDALARGMAKRIDERPESAMAYARLLQDVQDSLAAAPTRVEVLDASPSGPSSVDDARTHVRPVQVIVPEVIERVGTRLRPVVVRPRVDVPVSRGLTALTSPDTAPRGGARAVDPGSRPSVMRLGDDEVVDVVETPRPGRRARRVVGVLAAAVVVGVIGVLATSGGSPDDGGAGEDGGPGGTPGDGTGRGGALPLVPQDFSVVRDGSDVRLSWTRDDVEDGDVITVSGPNGPLRDLDGDTRGAVLPAVEAVCFAVEVVRSGRSSGSTPCEVPR